MTNTLSIAWLVLQLAQVTIQMEPESGWITNNAGQLSIPADVPIRHEAHVGKTIKIDWQAAEDVVLQQSEDMMVWYDVKVRFVNSSGWLAYPLGTRYYRLRSVW